MSNIVQSRVYNAVELLSFERGTPKLGVGFLDMNIRSKPRPADNEQFIGAGLYGVGFDDQLIYVGEFLGKSKARMAFEGNVAKMRWWAHLGSLTARSNKLHVSRTKLERLRQEIPGHQMLEALSGAGERLHNDQGCLGAENRLRFACEYWDDFASDDYGKVAGRFSFVYARISPDFSHVPFDTIKTSVLAAESQAKAELRPRANKETTDFIGDIPMRCAVASLSRYLEIHSTDWSGRG